MVMVLPDGSTLPTKKNKIGPGLDFSGLFIGGKSSFGKIKIIIFILFYDVI